MLKVKFAGHEDEPCGLGSWERGTAEVENRVAWCRKNSESRACAEQMDNGSVLYRRD